MAVANLKKEEAPRHTPRRTQVGKVATRRRCRSSETGWSGGARGGGGKRREADATSIQSVTAVHVATTNSSDRSSATARERRGCGEVVGLRQDFLHVRWQSGR